MDWILIWKAVGIVVIGTALLRIAGRKSIAQMTMAQVILMIGLGTLLIQPISRHGYWMTFVLAAVFVLGTIAMEYMELKSDWLEKLITGKSVIVIENGQIKQEQLKKLRLTIDGLEMRLRQAGISRISDVQWASLEVSGNIGYELKPEKQPATKEDIQRLIDLIQRGTLPGASLSDGQNHFSEIEHGHASPPPPKLQ
jgi:uncharacterized membrane protein YcaP (DUF421 family)